MHRYRLLLGPFAWLHIFLASVGYCQSENFAIILSVIIVHPVIFLLLIVLLILVQKIYLYLSRFSTISQRNPFALLLCLFVCFNKT